MDILNRLQMATVKAQQEDELPDYLAERIFTIAARLQGQSLLQAEIEELIEQLALYDTYGQTGYIGMGVNNSILEGTLCRIEMRLQDHPEQP
jgi:hypothetical protein